MAVNGYGLLLVDGRAQRAHRVVFEMHRGPIGNGLQLDHLCRVRSCVNPAHLDPVTPRENILRGMGTAAKNAEKTHCPKGHAYASENTIINRKKSGRVYRECRACKHSKDAAYRTRMRGQTA